MKPTSRVYKVGELWRWKCWCGAKGGDYSAQWRSEKGGEYHAESNARRALVAHQSAWSHKKTGA